MPTTPATWLNSIGVSTSGGASGPRIIQLTNGNILVVWTTSSDTGAGSEAGTDVVGRIFDPSGTAITGEIALNNGYFVDDEGDVDVTALPNGGFAVTYIDDDSSTQAVRLERYNADGTSNGGSVTVASDAAGGTTQSNPVIANSSGASSLVVWERADAGDGGIFGAIYDSTTNTMGPELSILSTALGDLGDPVVSTLTNGNYVVVARDQSGDSGFFMRILTPTGDNVLGFTEVVNTRTNTDTDTNATVTALTGGGFVVAWQNTDVNDTDIEFQVYNSAGATVGGIVTVNSAGATDAKVAPQIVAMADGGFAVVYDDNESNGLALQRYNSAGSTVGDRFEFATGNILSSLSQVTVTALSDGRFAVGYRSFFLGDSSISMEILDTQDVANATGTAFYGTIGNDTITGANTSVFAGSGNDILTEGSATVLDGGDGDDTIIVQTVVGSADVYRGGAGTDTIDWSVVNDANVVFDLEAGTAVWTPNPASTEGMVGFENLLGMAAADTILGSSVANELYGLGGNDIIDGRGGADRLFGGDGVDTLDGGEGNDILVGNAQIFVQQQDNLNGGNGDDLIYGENVDNINGGAGLDSLIAINAFSFNIDLTATSIEYAIFDFGNDVITAAGQTVGVNVFASGGTDSVTGSSFGDTLWGGSGNDTIVGGLGDDAVIGEAGADSLNGGDGNDRIYFDAQDTFVFGGAGNDAGYINTGTGGGAVVNMGASQLEFIQDFAGQGDTILGSTMTVGMQAYVGGGNDSVDGSAFGDVMYGENGNDTLNGNAGNDVLVGGAGGDILRGGLGNDALYGGAGDGVRDDFAFNAAGSAHADAVYDFVVGTDKIDLTSFAGNTFANVSIINSGGSAYVYLNGQLICTTIGTVGLGIGDFIMSGAAPADPGDTPIIKGDGALVQPTVLDDFVDAALVQPTVADDSFVGSPVDLSLDSFTTGLDRPLWAQSGQQTDGWLAVLV